MFGRPFLTMKEFGNISILSLLIMSKMVTLPKKCFVRTMCALISSATIFVSNIVCPDIYFASFSRDGSKNSYKSAGKVWVKTVRIKIDENFVVKSEEIPIRYCRVVHTFREMRRQTNGQRDLTRFFLLGCKRFWNCTGLSSFPTIFHAHN